MKDMRLLKFFLLLLSGVVLAVGATIAAARYAPPGKTTVTTKDYGPAPDFAIDGLKTADFGKRKVLLTFFASWCAPCKIEHPLLMGLAKDFPVWGIDTMDGPDDLAKFLKADGNPFAKIGHDDGGTAGIAWGVTGIPATYIIDTNGHIIYRHLGPVDADEVRDVIVPLMQRK